ncbi:methyltransferase [bacterium]|nr:methyltransferase [bacterium]
MSATSRELVLQTLSFAGPARVPRELWSLPIATQAYPQEYAAIVRDFPPDFAGISGHEPVQPPTRGDWYATGEYTDHWGCTFVNIQPGVIGEVKDAVVRDWHADRAKIHLPREWLAIDRDAVNRDCAATDRFTCAGCSVNPFERLQWIRGTENLYVDLLDPPPGFGEFVRELHQFNTELFTAWARTDVDSLRFNDDWGAQRALLIAPALWRDIFKPMYRDFVQIAHGAGKKIFMHSDGHITAIYPDLVEIGIDAVNSQLFCMGVENLKPLAGQITFWGEIDRQHLLPAGAPADIDRAVRSVHANLWQNGGCIAQCEFGAAAKPENVRQVFQSWNEVIAR